MRSRPSTPGTLVRLAPLVYARWTRVMRFDPQDPIWPNRDVHSRGVSMPSWDIFEHQPKEYRDGVLPPAITVPLKALIKEYGFTVDNVVAAAKAQLARVAQS
jgi:transketolase